MFQAEKDMIPVLKDSLSKLYNTSYFATEFNTGNGVADLVFTTEIRDERLAFNDYALMSLFVKHFRGKRRLNKTELFKNCNDSASLNKLLNFLENAEFIWSDGEDFVRKRNYVSHTPNLISIEAKLKDWKSGFYQALRYQFYSQKSYLAYPQHYIHRVDIDLLKRHSIGLISVGADNIKILNNPKTRKPLDVTSYFYLSENFAQRFRA